MTSVCFYFQIHQPFRLRRYSVFETHPFVFDAEMNQSICEKVAENCYRPATRTLLDMVNQYDGRFRVAFSITGTALEQFELWTPDVIELFQQLAATGCCEFLAETSHHSLAFLYSREEFSEQVALHRKCIRTLLEQDPTVFRNTEFLYHNELAAHLSGLGRYKAVLCEGVDKLLARRSPNHIYVPPGTRGHLAQARIKLLLKNHQLSDDIAFRFSDQSWDHWPLSAERFAHWIDRAGEKGQLCNLFIDYETLGEHHHRDTGIFDFLRNLPEELFKLNPDRNDFITPSQAVERYEPVDEYNVPEITSWADTERDASAWIGNALQTNSVTELYAIEAAVKAQHAAGDEYILEDWRKLTTSDHLYYMSTKQHADGDVHTYFRPYDSPYDAYINFMNVLDNIRQRAEG